MGLLNIIKETPIVGTLTEAIANDPYKIRLKSKLRRTTTSAPAAAAILANVAGGIGVVLDMSLSRPTWEKIDSAVAQLSEEDAQRIYSFVGVAPGIEMLPMLERTGL